MTLLTPEEIEEVVITNQGLIYDIVKKMKRKKPYLQYMISDEDLISAGNIGFLKALKNFDKDYGTKLSTFVTRAIEFEIYHEIERYQWPLRVPKSNYYNKDASPKIKDQMQHALNINKTASESTDYLATQNEQAYTNQEFERLSFALKYRKQKIKFNGYVIDNRRLEKGSANQDRKEKKIQKMILNIEEYING